MTTPFDNRLRLSSSSRSRSGLRQKSLKSLAPQGILANPTTRSVSKIVIVFALLLVVFGNGQLLGQNVSARISSREAWVGSPIVLQIQVANATKYSLPESFEIDGCDIRSAGTPSQSSQITIINGRRSESRSVTMQYFITPRREGKFQVPELEINVDGKTKTTPPIPFVATKSETGDLLFVEVEGDKESVYVGQPLRLKLKLWVKPFADREQRIKLNENHMWQMISEQTSWGAFADRLQELAENRQRPSGETVLRKDADGRDREYYLYEINATVYPNKPGKIDASGLQVVVNYPQSLGRSRDPFDSFFRGRSMMKDMMGDDFFSSAFGSRLTVSNSRPVAAEVSVDSTEVLAVPTDGQPADYRGAVGKYQIIAQAESTSVSAGDPITLQVGIVGDGPMELVQAPPLHQIESLTNGFQVTDQSLAGFVQGDTKVFVTSLRPRSEDVKQIPPIPFSFFDPDKKAYETVYSKPISIDVTKTEAFDMNSIVSDVASAAATNGAGSSSSKTIGAGGVAKLDLRNDFSSSLINNSPPKTFRWWWYFAIIPPIAWLTIAIGRIAWALPAGFSSLKSAKSKARRQIESAKEAEVIADALKSFVARRTINECPTPQHAVGKLREHNAYDIAAQLESMFAKLTAKRAGFDDRSTEDAVRAFQREALLLLDSIDRVVGTGRLRPSRPKSLSKGRLFRKGVTTSLIGFAILFAGSSGLAAEELATETLQTILDEANSTYQSAEKLADSDPAKAKQMFGTAAERYQLLIDQGLRSDGLFLNLGNSWYQSGETAKAIVNYHRALWMNQDHSTARKNLLAIGKLRAKDFDKGIASRGPSQLLDRLVSFTGNRPFQIVFAIASVLFWLLLAIKTVRPRSGALKLSIAPLLLAVASGLVCYQLEKPTVDIAVIMEDVIELKSADGEEFQTEANLNSVSGTVVSIIGQRAQWRKVQLADGRVGWLPQSAIERVTL